MGEPIKLALLGTYLPQKCGIATFTYDLYQSLCDLPNLVTNVFAISDGFEAYQYPEEVKYVIGQDIRSDYSDAAAQLNVEQYTALCVQHEYGIFGGEYGQWLMDLLVGVRIPIVTTLHTVLSDPPADQAKVTQQLLNLSSRVVVISEKAQSILLETYQVAPDKVQVIAHGVPDMALQSPKTYKQSLSLSMECLLLTFGLLSPSKGIEHMIDALPEIVKACPDVHYLVLGEAHPHYEKWSGRHYAGELQARADALGVADHFMIRNQFVTQSELITYLGAADIYITPYLSREQISSGTLSYAKATNNALVSTPYWYAQELIASDKNGRLVDFKNSQALSEGIIDLIRSPKAVTEIARHNYHEMREVTWSKIGCSYAKLFATITGQSSLLVRSVGLVGQTVQTQLAANFDLSFAHMLALTDDTGMFQHAIFRTPNRIHGYCVDDNARALVVSIWAQRCAPANTTISHLTNRYLSFLHDAFNLEVGAFRNFMSFDRRWLEAVGSEDCQGRAIWALGVVRFYSQDQNACRVADLLFKGVLPYVDQLRAPRALAGAILGLVLYDQAEPCSEIKAKISSLLIRLSAAFDHSKHSSWPWFEDQLTYDNARIPQALISGGAYLKNETCQQLGLYILSFLVEQQFDPISGVFVPVGNYRWYRKSGYHSVYDQQPIEACAMVSACLAAAQISPRNGQWQDYADRALSWFLGKNSIQQPVCDLSTGACADGLTIDGINENHGAESTVSWLLAVLECLIMRKFHAPTQPKTASAKPKKRQMAKKNTAEMS